MRRLAIGDRLAACPGGLAAWCWLLTVPLQALHDAWDTYREIHFPVISPRTRTAYKTAYYRAVNALPGVITTGAVLEWHRAMARTYSVSYANDCLHVLRGVSRRAAMVTGDTRLQALIWGVGAIREGVKAPRCPPRDLVRVAMPFCRNAGERLWLLLACLAGLRRGELLGLRASDWDPETHVLRVERQRRSPQRKNRKPLAVAIDAPDVRKLLELVIDHPELARSARAAGHPCAGYLFGWGYKYAASFLGHLRSRLGAKYFPRGGGWHVCRHWGATELARAGASVWDLCAWLGDSSPEVAQTYVDMVRGSSVGGVATLARRHGLFGPRRVSKKKKGALVVQTKTPFTSGRRRY